MKCWKKKLVLIHLVGFEVATVAKDLVEHCVVIYYGRGNVSKLPYSSEEKKKRVEQWVTWVLNVLM